MIILVNKLNLNARFALISFLFILKVQIDELNSISNMPNKLIELLNLTYTYSDIYCQANFQLRFDT